MSRQSSRRGVAVILGIFLVGGAVLWGLFHVPHAPPGPPAPADVKWGVPARRLRFVSYNILHDQRGMSGVVAEVKKLDPDFVLMQEVEYADVVGLASALGMQANFHPSLYYPSVNLAGPRSSWGNLILSRHPMYEGGSIPNPGGGS